MISSLVGKLSNFSSKNIRLKTQVTGSHLCNTGSFATFLPREPSSQRKFIYVFFYLEGYCEPMSKGELAGRFSPVGKHLAIGGNE
jgi:hypothetical protein